jgi:hypothetical protein
VIVVDTGPLYALVDAAEPQHDVVTDLLASSDDLLVTTPLVLAELDHLLGTRLGERTRSRVMSRLSGGAVHLSPFDRTAFEAASETAERYGDLRLGLTDASLVVAAERFGTTRLLTLDRRHFSAVRPRHAPTEHFVLLP